MRWVNFSKGKKNNTVFLQAYVINLPIGLDSSKTGKDVVRVNEKKYTPQQKSTRRKMVYFESHPIATNHQSLQLELIVLFVLVTSTVGLLVAFITISLKESSIELVPFPDEKGNLHNKSFCL